MRGNEKEGEAIEEKRPFYLQEIGTLHGVTGRITRLGKVGSGLATAPFSNALNSNPGRLSHVCGSHILHWTPFRDRAWLLQRTPNILFFLYIDNV